MSEKEFEAKTFIVKYFCDQERCSGGLTYTGKGYMVNPPQFEHKCEKCGFVRNLKNSYPVVVQRVVNEV